MRLTLGNIFGGFILLVVVLTLLKVFGNPLDLIPSIQVGR